MELKTFVKLLPDGLVFKINPHTYKYKFLKVVVNALNRVSDEIIKVKNIVPYEVDSLTRDWERMLGIENIEVKQTQRLENIKNKLIGKLLFNKRSLTNIIKRYTRDEDIDYGIINHKHFTCISNCNDSLGSEKEIFNVSLIINNEITNHASLKEELQSLKHAHMNLRIIINRN